MTNSTPQGHWLGHILARNTGNVVLRVQSKACKSGITRQVSTLNVLASSQQPKQQGKTITLAGTSILGEQRHHASILIIKHVISITLTWHECKQHGKHECIAG